MFPTSATPSLPSLPAFELRCRDAEWLDRPETLVDFGRAPKRAPRTLAQRYGGLSEVMIADAIARAHLQIRSLAGDRVIVTCETPRYGIPLGVRDLDRPPVGEWQLRDQIDCDLVDTDRHGRVSRNLAMHVRRGLIAVAGALPLLMSPMLAHANEGSLIYKPTLEQLAGFAPPKLPADTAPQPTPPVEQPTTTAPQVEPPATPPPTVAPPPAPRIQGETLSLTGTVLWEGLLGKQVRLEMKGGQAVTGVVVAQTANDLAIARTPDGTVVAVPKGEIAGVRLKIDVGAEGGSSVPIGDRPTESGKGAIAGGSIMVTIGAIAGLSGTVMLGIYPGGYYIYLPLLLPGIAMIGGGSALISAGGKKKKAYNKAWGIPQHSRLQMTPTVTGNRNGGMAGLVLRF